MLFSLRQALNYTAEAATLARFPNLRFFMTARATNDTEQWDLTPQPMSACDAAAPAVLSRAEQCAAGGFLNDTDFHNGQGLGHAAASSPAACCSLCAAFPGCKFFTFAQSVCWFKGNADGRRRVAGAVSGGLAPPPPPPPCNRWLTAREAAADDARFLLSFSAMCFLTVRNIAAMHTGNRPMALVQSAWGGSRVEAWMSAAAIESAGAPVTGNVPSATGANAASALFNGMVSPWSHFSIKAALWYQGEANADQSCAVPGAPHLTPVEYYAVAYAAMMGDWRRRKGAGADRFPVGTVQLPPSVKTGAVPPALWGGRPVIREAQAISAAHPGGNTTDSSGVAVTVDLGGASNWGFDHPPNKPEMARRLALQLLHTAYGLGAGQIPPWSGPVLASGTSSAGRVLLQFTSAPGGVALRDVKAPGSCNDGHGGVCVPTNNCTGCCAEAPPFEVSFDLCAAANVTWLRVPRANVTLSGSSVSLAVGGLATAVRYAWTDYVDCVLDATDGQGIPAAPFTWRR